MNIDKFKFLGSSNKLSNAPICLNDSIVVRYPCSSSISCSPFSVFFSPGSYYVELYGASGGNASKNNIIVRGGKGGFVSGIISFRQKRRNFNSQINNTT